MAKPIQIDIPHQLGRAEARRRVEDAFAKVPQMLPGGAGQHSGHWDGDRLVFSLTTMKQTVRGFVDVRETTIAMEIELPAVLALLARGIAGRVQDAGRLLLTKK